MLEINSLVERIKTVSTSNFDALALDIYRFQYLNNEVYEQWSTYLGKTPDNVDQLSKIPFLPIEFFKSHKVQSGNWIEQVVFESSGTSGNQTSRHLVFDEQFYLDNCIRAFVSNYGSISDYTILALLPSYLERDNSGLISMVNHFIELTNSSDSGFYLNELDELYSNLLQLRDSGRKVILWGVTFALIDFAEKYKVDFPELIVMETGGMKGRREELVRSEVHEKLRKAFGVNQVHSEYGMTELFSQAYSKGAGLFYPSNTMKVIGREVNDPLAYPSNNKTVAFNIIDLANIYTCSFIESKDIGTIMEEESFEVKGRLDNSDIRGCNLLVV